jgi:hypothetical protein
MGVIADDRLNINDVSELPDRQVLYCQHDLATPKAGAREIAVRTRRLQQQTRCAPPLAG